MGRLLGSLTVALESWLRRARGAFEKISNRSEPSFSPVLFFAQLPGGLGNQLASRYSGSTKPTRLHPFGVGRELAASGAFHIEVRQRRSASEPFTPLPSRVRVRRGSVLPQAVVEHVQLTVPIEVGVNGNVDARLGHSPRGAAQHDTLHVSAPRVEVSVDHLALFLLPPPPEGGFLQFLGERKGIVKQLVSGYPERLKELDPLYEDGALQTEPLVVHDCLVPSFETHRLGVRLKSESQSGLLRHGQVLPHATGYC